MYHYSKLLALILFGVLISFAGVQTIAHASPYDEKCLLLRCPELEVQTDKYDYVLGDKAIISGHISSEIFESAQPVMIQVFSPVEELVRVEVQPASDGTFSYVMNLNGEVLSIPFRYDVMASYGTRTAGESFYYMGEEAVTQGCGSCQYVLHLNKTRYEVDYNLNGIIQNITIDAEAKSLVIEARVDSSASFLDVSLNPELIKATELDQTGQERNVNFTVLVNGKNADKTNTSFPSEIMPANTDRRLWIEKLEEGYNRVEIVGTRVIPEFGSLGLIILIGAVAGLNIWTRSTVRKFNIT